MFGTNVIRSRTGASCDTPLRAAGRGVVAGMAATALLSVLARILPGMSNQPHHAKSEGKPSPPDDPEDREKVREWQERSRSPAAHQPPPEPTTERNGAPDVTPAGALVQPVSPGPEGLAEQFAFKLASGLFDRDISAYVRPAGLAVHFAYGSVWGLFFGLLQASHHRPPGLFGTFYGLIVYLVGPGLLVPAMKIMRSPTQEPPLRTAMLVAGHIIYGVTVAKTFEAQEEDE